MRPLAVSNNSWITIQGNANGAGSGTVSYSVSANSAASDRTGSLTIVDQTFTVKQLGVNANGKGKK